MEVVGLRHIQPHLLAAFDLHGFLVHRPAVGADGGVAPHHDLAAQGVDHDRTQLARAAGRLRNVVQRLPVVVERAPLRSQSALSARVY